ISSFQTWDEIGRWYWSLQQDRIEPTAAIRAKAEELTKGLTSDDAKLKALYSFVSMHYRYIGIAFGIGRYQPHAADDVLTNNYGDCKDKHTLLASLLKAAGITLYPALIDSSHSLDPEVPSPVQFDHVIGYLPATPGREATWMDTTPEVSPYGYLMPVLRNKPALVMQAEKSQLITTPAESVTENLEDFMFEGKLNDDGTLEAKIEDSSQGDSELVLRATFRQTAQSEWKELMQRISYEMGFAGTVSDVNASKPETLGKPFRVSYTYNRKDYPDWKTDKRLTIPGLPFFVPPVRDDARYPLWLGALSNTRSETKLEIPRGYVAKLPSDVDAIFGFAEYHSRYQLQDGVIIARRSMVTRTHEVPVAEFEHYRSFAKSVENDTSWYVYASPDTGSQMVTSRANQAVAESVRAIRDLPESDSAEASRLENEARNHLASGDMSGAVASLQQAVVADPKFVRALVMLGSLLFAQKNVAEGNEVFQKAIAVDPSRVIIPKAQGYGLMSARDFDEAVPVWQEFIKKYPSDVDGPANLGYCFLQLKRYSEAAAAYEAAVNLRSDRPALRVSMGNAYLLAGNRDKAAAVFAKIGEGDVPESLLNDVAYRMAQSDLQLPVALNLARKAVHAAEVESQKVTLPSLTVADLGINYK
ncbi:MAG TPA: tetratricopeptide repeat protein, partial [Terracidiphilus sp.]